MQNTNLKRLTYEAGVYSVLYILIGIIALITILFDSFLNDILIKDPIESLILILIAIVYFRGFLKLSNQDNSGIAFIFVAAIMGLLLGGLAFLNFAINGVLKDLLETMSFSKIRIDDYFSLSIGVGGSSFIPFQNIRSFKDKMEEK